MMINANHPVLISSHMTDLVRCPVCGKYIYPGDLCFLDLVTQEPVCRPCGKEIFSRYHTRQVLKTC